MVTQKEVNDAIDTLKKARKEKQEKTDEKDPYEEILYKENFI